MAVEEYVTLRAAAMLFLDQVPTTRLNPGSYVNQVKSHSRRYRATGLELMMIMIMSVLCMNQHLTAGTC